MKSTILFVDDDKALLASLHRLLRHQFQITTASSGAEGLQCLSGVDSAVVVSDFRMPGMDGIEFLARVREQSPDSIRILLTGYIDLQVALDAINESNIFRLLTKPIATAKMEAALQAGIEQYRLVMTKYELDQLKSRFDVNIAYKLRTAMTRSTIFLYQLEQGRQEETQAYLDKLKREIWGLVQIATDLVALSYLDLKNMRAGFVSLDLNTMADQVAKTCTEGTSLGLDVDLAVDLPQILAEESPVQMVITSLILAILSQTLADTLEVCTYASEDRVYLQVKASYHEHGRMPSRLFGYGIHKGISQLNRLADDMGWKLVREMVERYDGGVVVDSSPNPGVRIWFPATPLSPASFDGFGVLMPNG